MQRQEKLSMLKTQPLAATCTISATTTKPTGEYFGVFLSPVVKISNLTLGTDMP